MEPSSTGSAYKSQALTLVAVAAVAAAAGAVSIAAVHLTLQKRKAAGEASTARRSGGTDAVESDNNSTAARKDSLRATSSVAWSDILPSFFSGKPREMKGEIASIRHHVRLRTVPSWLQHW